MTPEQRFWDTSSVAATRRLLIEPWFVFDILIICPIAIAYSMGQIIESVYVCQCVCVSVRLRALSRSHFLIDFHQDWHGHKNPQKKERVH